MADLSFFHPQSGSYLTLAKVPHNIFSISESNSRTAIAVLLVQSREDSAGI